MFGVIRAFKRNLARRNNTALGPRGQAEISLKIENLRSNKTTDDQQPEFRCEFYIIIFLNKLKIVENNHQKKRRRKNHNKTSIAKAMRSFRESVPLLALQALE